METDYKKAFDEHGKKGNGDSQNDSGDVFTGDEKNGDDKILSKGKFYRVFGAKTGKKKPEIFEHDLIEFLQNNVLIIQQFVRIQKSL